MSYKTLLNEEIKTEFDELKKLEVGSEQYKTAVDGLTKLMDKNLEIQKFEADCDEKNNSRDKDYALKSQQLEDERKDRKTKNFLTAFTTISTLGVTIWGTIKSINFEKEGTITTIMGRGFIQKLLPKK